MSVALVDVGEVLEVLQLTDERRDVIGCSSAA
jgi:hypothetical protein